ncbi:hypothetical protein A0J61_10772 [Choanephora cucurbitarum]|uniref:GAR domain-containing protein n=1 Tax=Choanephora cucurbitarum TaxID=101091 RepID=A0A1C7MXR5_9FUNG|nr:hypothetical protein A0J61_10772 [Choanephora cucurbitarum]
MTIKLELSTIPVPDNEIKRLLDLHHTLASEEANALFTTIATQIAYWLEQVHLAIFILEQHQEEEDELEQLESIEKAMLRMHPIITYLSGDIAEIMVERDHQLKITKIQSEWSGLHHFVNSVKSQVISHQHYKQLSNQMDHVWLRLDDVSLMIFEIQEHKQQHRKSVDDDPKIQQMDHLFETLMHDMESIYTQLSHQDSPNFLRRLDRLKEKWETLQGERDELKQEHKEDRWLAVFKRVADQVDVMIDGLDKSAIQCFSVVQQIREWQSRSLCSALPMDQDAFWSLQKSFEAKYKYYTPSIDRMLSMLGNGISARASRDNTTAQRHEAMLQRWSHLKEMMDALRSKDLVETEHLVLSSSSAQSTSTGTTLNSYHTSSTLIQHPRSKQKPEERRAQSATPTYRQQSLLRTSLSDSSSVDTPPSKLKPDFYEKDERDNGMDLMMKPRRPPSSMRKTPTPRSKSSIGLRATSPLQRSMTPSLIPRPKEDVVRRPKSQMQHRVLPKKASMKKLKKTDDVYRPDPKDPLDMEVAQIVNASPIPIQCQRGDQPGKYYFGNELSISSMGGKKVYTCKLMTYANRRGAQFKNNKVLIRVGGGWQDLEFFLLEHSSLMASDVVSRSFTPTKPSHAVTAGNGGWRS